MKPKNKFENPKKEYLNQILRMTPSSKEWEAWLNRTQELPPDFSVLPSKWNLPDPLINNRNDKKETITTRQGWEQNKIWIKDQFSYWMFGQTPPAPSKIEFNLTQDKPFPTAFKKTYNLKFGPLLKANLKIEMLIPKKGGSFPVFMTQANHRSWGLLALQRGYMAVLYAACDMDDDSQSFINAYPSFDWSLLTRRAWAASRVIDFLETLPEVDHSRIILAGHSRNGKQSLIASAYDDRISAVIASSAGAIGVCSTRYFSEQHFGEGIELITRNYPDWFHPRLRFFVGRENHLPVDLHELVALSSPRPCLISSAINDNVESVYSVQKTFIEAQRVYKLYGKSENLKILWRTGGHETNPETIERYLDWCDTAFDPNKNQKQQDFIYPIDLDLPENNKQPEDNFNTIQINPQKTIPSDLKKWREQQQNIQQQIINLTGTNPPKIRTFGDNYGLESSYISELLFRNITDDHISKKQIVFGDYINADIYFCPELENPNKLSPTIIWLPPFSNSHGYHAGYFSGSQFYVQLAKAGYTVICFDPIGMGSRILEAQRFYQRYPNWSLFGKMVRDAQSAIDLVFSLEKIDPKKVFAVGYGLGAVLGIHLMAVEDRITGLAAVCPPSFIQDNDRQSQLNLFQWLTQYSLLRKTTNHVPKAEIDLFDMLACAAPKPTLLINPILDQGNSLSHFDKSLTFPLAIYKLFNAESQLTVKTPDDYNHLSTEIQNHVTKWLTQFS